MRTDRAAADRMEEPINMPTITVPLKSYDEYPSLKKSREFKKLADELSELSTMKKSIDERQAEIRELLYPYLKPLGEVKSVAISDDLALQRDDGGTTHTFSKDLMMQRPIKCHKCRATNHVTPVDIEACTVEGTRKPTVKVVPIKSSGKE